jgi:SAM-dependent methyltransferase
VCALYAAAQEPRFLSFSEARETLSAFGRTDDAAAWDTWVRAQDREVRARIDRGVEDSVSNLILYGTSFTPLPPLESANALSPEGALTDTARARLRAALTAMDRPDAGERLRFARELLARHAVRTREEGERLLDSNLVRFLREQREYEQKLAAAAASGNPDEARFVRSTLYDRRGLSVDTSLLPNFALEDTLAAMLRKHAIAPASIRTIAVIGPGLDFADKRGGYDFYPLQTIQPIAMMEATIRLGLASGDGPRVTAFDLNSMVLNHVRQLATKARAGAAYILNLPHEADADWTAPVMAYWQHFGDRIASPAPAAPAPKGVTLRAVSVAPQYAARLSARDLNVVGQVADGEQFDLVVATNILVYYDRFQQVLALNSIARMMAPGGLFLSNTVLPAERPAEFDYLGRRSVSYSVSGAYGDDIVVYRRK